MDEVCANTDKELWRERPGDYYANSLHVTEGNGIGIDVGGHVLVAPIKAWHKAGLLFFTVNEKLPRWRWKLGMWILNFPISD